MNNQLPVISDLYFYPVKSLRGLRVSELVLEKDGARFDRQWMLVDEKNNFVTQRHFPQLARIGVAIQDESSIGLSLQDFGGVDFGMEEREGDEFTVTIWKDTVPAFQVSSEVSEWMSDFLKKKVRLVRLSPNARRTFNGAPLGHAMRFVDDRPLLVISRASLQDLEARAKTTLSISRFRPNIVVQQTPAYVEDGWGGFSVGTVDFQATKPCTRCTITTVHPLTGTRGEEPLKTLGTYRRIEKGVAFGYYFAHLNEGRIKIGDSLSPRARPPSIGLESAL